MNGRVACGVGANLRRGDCMKKLLLVIAVWLLQVAVAGTLAHAANPAVSVAVDANAKRHAINPNVYGVALSQLDDQGVGHDIRPTLTDLNVPLNRSGGNNQTRYNWQINAVNLDNDY